MPEGKNGTLTVSAEVSKIPGQQFADAGNGVVGDALQDVPEIELRIETVELGYAGEGVDGRRPR
jgi:hypothetical protein